MGTSERLRVPQMAENGTHFGLNYTGIQNLTSVSLPRVDAEGGEELELQTTHTTRRVRVQEVTGPRGRAGRPAARQWPGAPPKRGTRAGPGGTATRLRSQSVVATPKGEA